MYKKLSTTLLGALVGFMSATSFAQLTDPFSGYDIQPEIPASFKETSHTDSNAYAGLVWTWGNKQGLKPDFLLGFRSLHVESSDTVQGGDFNVRVKYNQGLKLDGVRLAYVAGKRNFMGNYGVGYSFTNKDFLATVAGQGDFYRFGTDYSFKNKALKPYAEINTLERPDGIEPNVQPGGCPTGYSIVYFGGFTYPNDGPNCAKLVDPI